MKPKSSAPTIFSTVQLHAFCFCRCCPSFARNKCSLYRGEQISFLFCHSEKLSSKKLKLQHMESTCCMSVSCLSTIKNPTLLDYKNPVD
jgi:hypothetical protein